MAEEDSVNDADGVTMRFDSIDQRLLESLNMRRD